MITLQTPGTGFDDFESRIALGLCRVALDCVGPEQVILEESHDRFIVRIDVNEERKGDLAKSLAYWCIRSLSDQNLLLRTPGSGPSIWRNKQRVSAISGLRQKISRRN